MKVYSVNRIYSVFSKSFWKFVLGVVLPCELMIVIWAIARSSFGVKQLTGMGLVFVVALVGWLLARPAMFILDDSTIRCRMYLQKDLPFFMRVNKQKNVWSSMTVSVCRISKIEYAPWGIGTVGSLRLTGEIRTQNQKGEYEDVRNPPKTVEFFGVCNFQQVCRDLREAFPQAEHI